MTFYITTPIYYVNDVPHIGHAYTTVLADVLARYHRLFGEDVFFLTGTDEHGQKVQTAAKQRGRHPQEHVDEMVVRFQQIWAELEIKYDVFMRTTFDYHKQVVRTVLSELWEKGDIYEADYEGWYSISEEIFYTEKDLINGKSPIGKEVTKITEKNYFFRMSRFQERLIQYIELNQKFIQPDGKRSEVLGFLRQPLGDLCISRPKSRLSWGVSMPFNEEYVTYVWFDALLNYLSAVGYRQSPERQEMCRKLWPNVIHLIGKDILTTHAVYWSTMLMALDISLPKQIYAHGWWLNDTGVKMSKSEGVVVAPLDVKQIVGTDPFRYFLVRDITLGNDAQFSKDLVINRVNSELANNLGNLASRSISLAHKYFGGLVPPLGDSHPASRELRNLAHRTPGMVKERILDMAPSVALQYIIDLLSATNRYMDVLAPWKAAKDNLPLAGECISHVLEVLRISASLLHPVMPNKMGRLLEILHWTKPLSFEAIEQWGLLVPGTALEQAENLFPRIETQAAKG